MSVSASGTLVGGYDANTPFPVSNGVTFSVESYSAPVDGDVYYGCDWSVTLGPIGIGTATGINNPNNTGLFTFGMQTDAGDPQIPNVSSVLVTGIAGVTYQGEGGVYIGRCILTINGVEYPEIDNLNFGTSGNVGTTINENQTATFWAWGRNWTFTPISIAPETIAITAAQGVVTQPTFLSGTFDTGTFDDIPSTMNVQFDGGEWEALSSLQIDGDAWAAAAASLSLGEHVAVMQDAARPYVESNPFTFTVTPLPPLLALDTATGQLGGNAFFTGHSTNGTITNLYVKLDTGAFEAALDYTPGTPFSGQASADLAYGEHTVQLQDHDNPSNTSNTLTFNLAAITTPAWPIDPTWQNGIIERFEWITDVLQSYSGVEQRRQVRPSPRRSVEMTCQATKRYRSVYDLALKRAGSDQWYVPLWFQRVRLTTAITAGTDAITADITDLDFGPGQVILLWTSATLYELATVAALDGTTITLVAPTSRGYAAGASMVPAMQAWLTDEPSAARYADQALQATMQFTADSYNDYGASLGTVSTYQGMPVLTAAPDEAPSATFKFQRVKFEYDPTTGVRAVVDTMGFGAQTTQYALFAYGRAGYNALRAFFYALAGRTAMCWIPTFACDLLPTVDIGATDTAITALRNSFEVFAGTPPLPGRENIMIATCDGNFYFTTLGAAAVIDDDTFSVTITPLGVAVPLSNILRISFITTARADTDVNELMHHTDVNGPTTASVVFREVPNTRTDGSYAFDPSNTSGGFLTDFHQTFNVTDPEPTPFAVGITPQTAGMLYVEIELDPLNGAQNAGYVFGLGPAGLSFAQISSGHGGVFLITSAGSWTLYVNGAAVLSGAGQDFPGMIGLAVNVGNKECWFRTFDLSRTDYSYAPYWNGSADSDPNKPGTGTSFSALAGPFLLYAASAPNVGLIASLNVGGSDFLMIPPPNYTGGWPATEG